MTRYAWLGLAVVLAGCKKEARREVELAAQAVRERIEARQMRRNPKAWRAKRRRTEIAARTPPTFVYQSDTLAIRDVSAKHRKLITGRIDVFGIKQPDGTCTVARYPWVNPRYGLFPEVGRVNFRTCVMQVWVVDPHLPEYGPMSSDTVVSIPK
jgi:hypothetical protein